MATNKWLALALAFTFWGTALAGTVTLNPNHPDRYVVLKGDTLWGISARFLRDPWLWPEVWAVNPQIKNPHLIYPGDVITLSYVNGKPQLHLERGGAKGFSGGTQTVKLRPKIRHEPLPRAIPTIPMEAIRPFLSSPRVVGKDTLAHAPYVVEIADEHLIGANGNRIYARRLKGTQHKRFAVVRGGEPYRNPRTHEILGYEAIHVADAVLQRDGDPATLTLTKANREVEIGDRLLPVAGEPPQENFYPHAPKTKVDGQIIAVMNGVSQIGSDQVVVLDLGAHEGMRRGDVLAIYQAGRRIHDPVAGAESSTVTLPDERAGVLMVFRTFDRVSYALVMQATRAIHVDDAVRNP